MVIRRLFPAACLAALSLAHAEDRKDPPKGSDKEIQKAIRKGQEYLLGDDRGNDARRMSDIQEKMAPLQKEMQEMARNRRTNDARYKDLSRKLQGLQQEMSQFQDNFMERAVHLETYALIASGVSRDDKRITKRLDRIRKKIRDGENNTYDLALSILALTEGLPVPDGRYGGKENRIPEVETAIERLVEGQSSGGGWTYTCTRQQQKTASSHNGDLSNIQFAVLGLAAARQKGYRIPEETWERIKDGFEKWFIPDASAQRQNQKPGGQKEKEKKGEKKKKSYGKKPGGWGYTATDNDQMAPTGSMTCAGICSVILADAALKKKPVEEMDPMGPPEIEPALAYLDEIDLPRFFGDDGEAKASGHFFYHLYSIERTGSFCRLEKIGKHDWYAKGSRMLLDLQNENGCWSAGFEGPTVSTAFALLFLSRATLQTFVRKGYVVGGLDEPPARPVSGPLDENLDIPPGEPPPEKPPERKTEDGPKAE